MKFSPMLAGLDQFVVLIVFALLAAASSWLTKRRQGAAPDDAPTDAPMPAKPAVGEALDLDTIFRRLLSGEAPAAAKPPPLPGQPAHEAAPPELWAELDVPPAAAPPPPPPPPPPRPVRPALRIRPITARVGARSTARRAAAAPLPSGVARPATAKHLDRGHVSADGARLVARLRNAGTARQAFLAAQVFGPPKAMEN